MILSPSIVYFLYFTEVGLLTCFFFPLILDLMAMISFFLEKRNFSQVEKLLFQSYALIYFYSDFTSSLVSSVFSSVASTAVFAASASSAAFFFVSSLAVFFSASNFFLTFCGIVSIFSLASRLSYTTTSVRNFCRPKFVLIFFIIVNVSSFPNAEITSDEFGVASEEISTTNSSLCKNGFFSCLIIFIFILTL